MIRLRKDGPVWGVRGMSGAANIAPGRTYEGPLEEQLLADFPRDFERVEREQPPPPPPPPVEEPPPELADEPIDAGTYVTREMTPAPRRKRGRPKGSRNRAKG